MCNSVEREQPPENMLLSRFVKINIFLIFVTAIYFAGSFQPLTKQEQIKRFDKMEDQIEPLRRNLTECARQVRASMEDVQNFLKRIPQSTLQGQCFVACILKRNSIITNNKININNLLGINKIVYGENNEIWTRLQTAAKECLKAVDNIFEICEYASTFNDCMVIKMEHVLDNAMMEERMEALGQINEDPDYWTGEEDEMLKLLKDEL